MAKYIMALDQGTTSSRCILFDKAGNICSMAQREFEQIYPKPGWVEHNPMEIWSTQYAVMSEAMALVGAKPKDIAGIGITNQRETTIVWDKETGEPVYNAIVWQCRRTAKDINLLVKDGYADVIKAKTGLVPDAYFSATKIAWILSNVAGARKKAEEGRLLFGTVDTWLIWKLTGGAVHVTDYTNASRTMLFDIHNRCWDKELLEKFNIPEVMLPIVKPSSCIYGYTDPSVLAGNIAIAGAAGDQQAALFGQCCFEPGEVKNTYGTGCFLLMNTGDKPVESKHGLITTIAAGSDDQLHYAVVSGSSTITVNKAAQSAPNAPELESHTSSSITLKTIADANGAKVQYRINGGEWQDSPTFTGLRSSTEYTFEARYAATGNYEASDAGTAAKFSTRTDSWIGYTYYTLTFETNGGSEVPDQTVALGGKIRQPEDPAKEGFYLEGWYSDMDLQHKWDFSQDTVSGNMTLYARWTTDAPARHFSLWWLLLLLLLLIVILLILWGRRNSYRRGAAAADDRKDGTGDIASSDIKKEEKDE